MRLDVQKHTNCAWHAQISRLNQIRRVEKWTEIKTTEKMIKELNIVYYVNELILVQVVQPNKMPELTIIISPSAIYTALLYSGLQTTVGVSFFFIPWSSEPPKNRSFSSTYNK